MTQGAPALALRTRCTVRHAPRLLHPLLARPKPACPTHLALQPCMHDGMACVWSQTFLRLKGSVFEHVETLWNETIVEFAAGTYKPSVEPALLRCVRSLDWWQPPPPL